MIKEKKNFVDYLFWLCIIFYLDPGGYIVNNFNIRIVKIVFIALIWISFLYVTNFKGIAISLRNITIKKVNKVILLWLLYFFIVFLFFQDNYTQMSFLSKVLKTRLVWSSWLLFLPIYYFLTYRGAFLFIKLFITTSFLLALLFLVSYFTDIDLIYSYSFSRGYADVNRVMLYGFGLIELCLPLLIVCFILPPNLFFTWKNKLIYSSLGVYLIYFLSLTRRYFLYIIMSVGIGYFFSKFIFRSNRKFQLKIIFITIVLTFIMIIFFSNYVEGIIGGFKTFDIVNDGSYGTTKQRFSLISHKPTVAIIKENILFGSGYINEWYTNVGENKYGLEGADYVFLSTIGMFGFVGIFIFFPFYWYLVRTILKGLKFVKNNRKFIITNSQQIWEPLIIFLTTSMFFIRHVLTYPNWFSFIGPHGAFERFIIFAAMVYGSLTNLQIRISSITSKNYK